MAGPQNPDIMEDNAVKLLERAVSEITHLKTTINAQAEKIKTFESAVMLVEAGRGLPQRGYGKEHDLRDEISSVLYQVKMHKEQIAKNNEMRNK